MKIKVTAYIGAGKGSETFILEDGEIEGMTTDEINDYVLDIYGAIVIDNNVFVKWKEEE